MTGTTPEAELDALRSGHQHPDAALAGDCERLIARHRDHAMDASLRLGELRASLERLAAKWTEHSGTDFKAATEQGGTAAHGLRGAGQAEADCAGQLLAVIASWSAVPAGEEDVPPLPQRHPGESITPGRAASEAWDHHWASAPDRGRGTPGWDERAYTAAGWDAVAEAAIGAAPGDLVTLTGALADLAVARRERPRPEVDGRH